MNTTYVGLVDGLHTYEVRDDSGTIVGYNRAPYPPCPGEGYVLNDDQTDWVQAAQN